MSFPDLSEGWRCESYPGCAQDCTSKASSTGVRLKGCDHAEQPPSHVQRFLGLLEFLPDPHDFYVVGTGMRYQIGGKIASKPQIL
jgi:hypothetical protein